MNKLFLFLLLMCFSTPCYSQMVFNSPGNSISMGGEDVFLSVKHKNFSDYLSNNLVIFAPYKEKTFNEKLEKYLDKKNSEEDKTLDKSKEINKIWCLITAQPNSDTIRVDYNSDFLKKNKSKGAVLTNLLNSLYSTKLHVEVQQGMNIIKYDYDYSGFSYSLEKNWVNETRIIGNTVIIYSGPKEKSQPIKQEYITERVFRETSLEILLTKEKLK